MVIVVHGRMRVCPTIDSRTARRRSAAAASPDRSVAITGRPDAGRGRRGERTHQEGQCWRDRSYHPASLMYHRCGRRRRSAVLCSTPLGHTTQQQRAIRWRPLIPLAHDDSSRTAPFRLTRTPSHPIHLPRHRRHDTRLRHGSAAAAAAATGDALRSRSRRRRSHSVECGHTHAARCHRLPTRTRRIGRAAGARSRACVVAVGVGCSGRVAVAVAVRLRPPRPVAVATSAPQRCVDAADRS